MQALGDNKKSLNFYMFATLLPFTVSLLVLLFLLLDQSVLTEKTRSVLADTVSVSACIFAAAILYLRHKHGDLNWNFAVILLIAVGICFRLSYVIDYGYYEHQHDVESLNTSGHLSYIYNLAEGKGLPQSNDWQFSHPPLYHLFAAAVVKLSFALGFTFDRAFENVQLLTLLFSTLTLLVAVSLFSELKLNGTALAAATAVAAFHPTFFILSGSINNDCLALLLSLCALLFTVKWWNSPTWLNSVLIGLLIGLGMMAKFSVVMFIPITAIVVIVKLIFDKKYSFGKFLAQTGLFLVAALPTGLWYQIRNLIRFNQPIGYVAPLSETSALYTGGVSFAERLLLPFSTKLVGVYVNVWEEYNLFTYALRNSMFGEYTIGNMVFAFFLVLFNFFAVVLTVVSAVRLLKKGRGLFSSADWVVLAALVVQLAFFVYFNARYPFGCTMDYRYISVTAVCSAMFLGNNLSGGPNNRGVASRVISISTVICVVGFCAFSMLTYI